MWTAVGTHAGHVKCVTALLTLGSRRTWGRAGAVEERHRCDTFWRKRSDKWRISKMKWSDVTDIHTNTTICSLTNTHMYTGEHTCTHTDTDKHKHTGAETHDMYTNTCAQTYGDTGVHTPTHLLQCVLQSSSVFPPHRHWNISISQWFLHCVVK